MLKKDSDRLKKEKKLAQRELMMREYQDLPYYAPALPMGTPPNIFLYSSAFITVLILLVLVL